MGRKRPAIRLSLLQSDALLLADPLNNIFMGPALNALSFLAPQPAKRRVAALDRVVRHHNQEAIRG